MNQSQASLVNPSNPTFSTFSFSGLEGFTNDVWLWFILSKSCFCYTIPTYVSFFREKVFKILVVIIIYHLHFD